MARTVISSVSVSPRGLGRRDIGLSVVWLRGEHDIVTVSKLARTLAWAVALDDADVVVDLSGVRFMGAETVGAIVAARTLLVQSRSLTLRSPRRGRRVIELFGLSGLVDPPTVAPSSGGSECGGLAGGGPCNRSCRRVFSPRPAVGEDRSDAGLTFVTGRVSSAAAGARADRPRRTVPAAGDPERCPVNGDFGFSAGSSAPGLRSWRRSGCARSAPRSPA